MSATESTLSTAGGGPVVVGVADTPAGSAAVRAAAREARARGCQLVLVRVWREIDQLLSMTRAQVARLSSSELTNKLILEEAAWLAGSVDPDVRLSTELVPGNLYAALIEQSRQAQLLILGTDSAGAEGGLGHWLLQHALCPTLLVDEAGRPVAQSAGGTAGAELAAAP